jgi:FkbM family methyltransferase
MPRIFSHRLARDDYFQFMQSVQLHGNAGLLRNWLRDHHVETEALKRAFLNSRSQLGQDIVMLLLLNFTGEERPGIFLEFGAADGIVNSNTYSLEKELGWSGLLCEPGRGWHKSLKFNRSCTVSQKLVGARTGDNTTFYENQDGELSGSINKGTRDIVSQYNLQTISLDDLLQSHSLQRVEYLSIDTEGSELSILSEFSFGVRPKFFSVEHNYSPDRIKIEMLMIENGYKRIQTRLSHFDDWYYDEGPINKKFLNFLEGFK